MTRWKAFRHQLEAAACALLARAVPCLPRRWCVRLGDALGTLAFRLDGRGRAVALANVRSVFGERFSERERRALAAGGYRNFVRTMLDLFWASRLTPENFRDYLKPEGFDELQERLRGRKGGAVFFCIHQGNWEWGSLVFGFLGLKTLIVAENFKNPRLTAIFRRLREVSGHQIIPQENSILRLLKVVKRGGWAGLLIDLNLRPSQAATAIGAFGKGERRKAKGEGGETPALDSGPSTLDPLLMCVPLLHAVLAQRAGALLVPVETKPEADGTCRVIAHPAVEFPEDATVPEIAQRCWDAMEPIVHARPWEWLWAYKHFRYRPRGAGREYPFYANESGKFEKLRKTL